jgi:hypothetical protein
METPTANSKLTWCENELRALLVRLIEGNYHITAENIFDHIAHSGVDMKLNPELEKLTLEEFLKNQKLGSKD